MMPNSNTSSIPPNRQMTSWREMTRPSRVASGAVEPLRGAIHGDPAVVH